ncbi:hypothetical protein [Nocardia sp. NPDC052112]|uniref:hypothetical protein n=1 Tax=Nocardia sp. NPDC052112 TaxID=3155646 RepID=UPI003431E2A5
MTMQLDVLATTGVPVVGALFGAVVSALASGRVRAIIGDIFRHPRQSSVVVSVGGSTTVYEVSATDVSKVIEALEHEHIESQHSDMPGEQVDHTNDDENQAPA